MSTNYSSEDKYSISIILSDMELEAQQARVSEALVRAIAYLQFEVGLEEALH
ncbi:hypothetical protein MMB17_07645 [Methylobacterium organophilum]|uniref:hypothetical protein n=1 Tax=Methylobacterium organophilum TaxID=410 RepID=UPI001F137D86|nr:hypothetical protein [Methylobacterium organophilum]UMY19162.1 hypothetical protein MMB17_07645 [Methylobacterium organophilum]